MSWFLESFIGPLSMILCKSLVKQYLLILVCLEKVIEEFPPKNDVFLFLSPDCSYKCILSFQEMFTLSMRTSSCVYNFY